MLQGTTDFDDSVQKALKSQYEACMVIGIMHLGYRKKKKKNAPYTKESVRQPRDESLVGWRMCRLSISLDSSLILSVSEIVGFLPTVLLSGGRVSEKEKAEHLTCLCESVCCCVLCVCVISSPLLLYMFKKGRFFLLPINKTCLIRLK